MKLSRIVTSAIVIFSFVLGIGAVNAGAVATLPEEQAQHEETLQFVNDQINSLTRLRNYYMAKSARYRTKANTIRHQHGENSQEEYERLNQQADDYDNIVKNLNGEITKLDKQKRTLEKKT